MTDYYMKTGGDSSSATTNPGTGAITQALTVPTGIQVTALTSYGFQDATAAGIVNALVTSLDQSNTVPSSTLYDLACGGTSGVQDSAYLPRRTNTSGQIRYRLNSSDANVTMDGTTHGWIDDRAA